MKKIFEEELKSFEQSDEKVRHIDYLKGSHFEGLKDILPETDDLEHPVKSLKEGYENLKTVVGVYFMGGMDVVLQKLENDPELGLGTGTEDTWYGLNFTWGTFSPEDVLKNIKDK
jgi:hypothetical protein